MSRSAIPREASEGSRETVTGAIVRRVASVTGRDVDCLPPLYDAVDPDALEAIFDADDGSATSIRVAFDYAGRRVTVTDGTVRVGTAEG